MRITLCLVATLLLMIGSGHPQEKLGQTGDQFLSVTTDAQAGGMANATTVSELGSAALFFNPAGMARLDAAMDVSASQNQWIADITYNSVAAAFRPGGGRWGTLGLSVMAVDYGKIQGTVVWGNDKGYMDTELLNPTAYAWGVGYARKLTDRFLVGGQIKVVGLNYGRSIYPDAYGVADTVQRHIAFTTAFDFGTLYYTGWHNFAFGMTMRNFSGEVTFEDEAFQLPLTFSLGVGMDVLRLLGDRFQGQALQINLDALHYRSHPEQLRLGLEYRPIPQIALRGGLYSDADENRDQLDGSDLTFGVGIRQFGIHLDYAYAPKGVWNEVHRLTAGFSF